VPGLGVAGWPYPIAVGVFQAGTPVFASSWPYVPSLAEALVDLLPFGLALLVIVVLVSNYSFLPQQRVQLDQMRPLHPTPQGGRFSGTDFH
jgi:molybdopterin-containing oxidoreductase family membrane subunit